VESYPCWQVPVRHIVRRPPLGRAPLVDAELVVNVAEVLRGAGTLAVVAPEPLTRWVEATPGTLVAFEDGDLVTSIAGQPAAAHVAATAWRPPANSR
jgi:glutamine amidotransferase class II-like protein